MERIVDAQKRKTFVLHTRARIMENVQMVGVPILAHVVMDMDRKIVLKVQLYK
jgi:hypothetical protein